MENSRVPKRLLVIDIDGLRQDVFHQALERGLAPHLNGLLRPVDGQPACHLNPVSPVPSITFCAQSTIFTGRQPETHGIAGNQFFDRFGKTNGGQPRFYAFDVGDALAYNDAVLTFTSIPSLSSGLAGQVLASNVPTLYEIAGQNGKSSTVVYHMISRGAQEWIRPSLVDIARFTKGGGLIGISAKQYDEEMLEKTLSYLRSGARPDVLTVYFMGLDHTSHAEGPGSQLAYLTDVIDPLLGQLTQALQQAGLMDDCLVAVVSDHGQIEVIPDDRHSLRLSFPFDREMGYLFDALGLDVHDKPGEGPNCNAVVASNGGLAQVYLRGRTAAWSDLPRLEEDVLPIARAFWEAHQSGKYAPDLYGALAMVLVRDVRGEGWQADYQAFTPEGRLVPPGSYLAWHPEIQVIDAEARLRHLSGPFSGDLLLFSNYADGFYFGGPTVGVHGGLHPQESLAVASLGWLGASNQDWQRLISFSVDVPQERRTAEGRERSSLADLLPILTSLMGWK